MLSLTQLLQRRPRNRITIKAPKHIKQNPRITRLIKARRWRSATQLHRSTPTDDNIDALRIRLRTIGLATSMQCNDLVTNDIVTRSEVGNRQVPGESVLD